MTLDRERLALEVAKLRHTYVDFGLKRVRVMAIDEMIARAILADIAAQGFAVVPVEPTVEQLNAAVDATDAGSGMSWNGRSPQKLFSQAWTAMLDAAKGEGG